MSSRRSGADPTEPAATPPERQGRRGLRREEPGSWLRPAVFGVMDGLVSNVSLIAGVGGGGAGRDTLVLAGLAGLVAGGFSMATGEYTSVRTQNEAIEAQIQGTVVDLADDPDATRRWMAEAFERRGMRPEVAEAASADVSSDPEEVLRTHACELLGVDPGNLASPWVAGSSSFLAFGVGAFVPLLPYFVGWSSLAAALMISAVALFGVGALVSTMTARSPLYSGVRQLALGGLSAGMTYLIGSLIGASIA